MSDEHQGADDRRAGNAKAADPRTNSPDDASRAPEFSKSGVAEGFDTLSKFAAAVERLAALPEHEYERVRKDEAALLQMRVTVLDKHVKRARPKENEDGRAGRAIVLPVIEPWPDPVDGPELISALLAQLQRFLIASEAALIAVALWILHTHAFEAWWISPKLLVRSATRRCGKTRVFEVIERLVRRRLLVSAATSSSVFRVIEACGDDPPTLLMDEADDLTKRDDDMRKLINAGQTKTTASVITNVPCGDGWEPRQFSTWAPIAMAGIGGQADTIHDRSVTLKMKRKPKVQLVTKLRGNQDYGFHELARKCARWGQDHVEALKDAEPPMPEELNDRAQDNWEPLIAIADAIGGEWPRRARRAALVVQQAAEEMDQLELAVQLLHDIDDVFEAEGATRLTTAYLLIRLHEMEERLWPTYGRTEHKLNANDMSELLRDFEVRSKQMKFTIDDKEVNLHGYEKAWFTTACPIPEIGRYPATFRRNPGQLPFYDPPRRDPLGNAKSGGFLRR